MYPKKVIPVALEEGGRGREGGQEGAASLPLWLSQCHVLAQGELGFEPRSPDGSESTAWFCLGSSTGPRRWGMVQTNLQT